jgi:hypothetical protein
MDKAERANVIRELFKAKVGKAGYVSSGRAPRKATGPAKESKVTFGSFGLALSHRWGRTQWLEAADAEPAAQLGERNRTDVPALAKIAEKAPRRLVRRCRTAEELIAGRARR